MGAENTNILIYKNTSALKAVFRLASMHREAVLALPELREQEFVSGQEESTDSKG
jgi:hypothetical protein